MRVGKGGYAWIAALPAAWLLICTATAGWIKIFSADPAVGAIAQAMKYQAAARQGLVLAPATSRAAMNQIIFNAWVNAALTVVFLAVMLSVLVFGVRIAWGVFAQRDGRVRPVEALL
jgi:carbon starvation protein CstA